MSWNFGLRLNNLQNEVDQLTVGTVTNPLTTPLNCNSLAINNATTITASTGQNLSLNTSGTNSVTINGPVNIPNHPLTITNNTSNDSMIVSDITGDTSVFRIDSSGNVGVKVNTSTTLTNDFTVSGNTLVTGNETVSGNITCNQLNYTTLNPPVTASISFSQAPDGPGYVGAGGPQNMGVNFGVTFLGTPEAYLVGFTLFYQYNGITLPPPPNDTINMVIGNSSVPNLFDVGAIKNGAWWQFNPYSVYKALQPGQQMLTNYVGIVNSISAGTMIGVVEVLSSTPSDHIFSINNIYVKKIYP